MTACQHRDCGREATFACIEPNEIRPRRVVLACSRHGRRGYYVHLSEADAQLAHLLSIDAKRRAGAMLAAVLRGEAP